MSELTGLLVLASEGAEGIPGTHIAAKLAVPLGILIFGGAVYALLWSNYGAKKGALIYGTAFFGFTMVLGVFWWFGAPGTPVATGLQHFPWQDITQYQGKWFPFEANSGRAEFFPATSNPDNFVDVATYTGNEDLSQEELESDPEASFISGDLEQAAATALNLYLPTDETGDARLGANRRLEYQEAAGAPQEGETRASPFFTGEVSQVRVTDDQGTRVAAATLTILANFQGEEGGSRTVEVDTATVFAFKDPGALWFPSAVWTLVSLALFLLFLFALDRMEQSEKRARADVREPEDLAVPVAQ